MNTTDLEQNQVDEDLEFKTESLDNQAHFQPNLLPVVLLMLIVYMGQIGTVNGQGSYELPDVVRSCETFNQGTTLSMAESGFQSSIELPVRMFEEVKPGVVSINFNYWLTPTLIMEYDFLDQETAELMYQSFPLIDYFLGKAFEKIEGYEYEGSTEETDIYLTLLPEDITGILIHLSMGLPQDAADYAFLETINYLKAPADENNLNGLPIDPITRARAEDFQDAMAIYKNFVLDRMPQHEVDFDTLETYEGIARIDDDNWNNLKIFIDVPDEIWDFMEARGFEIKMKHISQIKEGAGKFDFGVIIVSYDNYNNVLLEVIYHEFSHAMREIVKGELSGYLEFDLADGSGITDNFDYAFAVALKYYYENDLGNYPIFEDVIQWVLYGESIDNADLANYLDNIAAGYVDLFQGDLDKVNDVNSILANVQYGDVEVNGAVEAAAMIDEMSNVLCLQQEAGLIPPYIADLYDLDRVVDAINKYNLDRVEG
jgi:hypothetical protein